MTWLGLYRMGVAVGQCWQWREGGGWLTGKVRKSGTYMQMQKVQQSYFIEK